MRLHLTITKTRHLFNRPKRVYAQDWPCWVVIQSLEGDSLTFDPKRGDDEEVVTRSPRVFGPTTLGNCQAFCRRAILRGHLHEPIRYTAAPPRIRGNRCDTIHIDEVE